MPLPNRKSRTISFRLTDSEFRECRDLCEVAGVNSISALARFALHQLKSRPSRPAAEVTEAVIQKLEHRLMALEKAMSELTGQGPREPLES